MKPYKHGTVCAPTRLNLPKDTTGEVIGLIIQF